MSNPPPRYQMFVWINAGSIIALMLVAASTTAMAFVASAQNELIHFFGDNLVVLGIAILIGTLAVIGVEGLIVSTGMLDGLHAKSEDEAEPEQRRVKRTRERTIAERRRWAAYILLGLSCIANLYSPVGLIDNSGPAMNFILGALAIWRGFGIPIAILLTAPVLSYFMNYQRRAEQDWLDEARRQFNNSQEAQLAQGEMQMALQRQQLMQEAQMKEQQLIQQQQLRAIRRQGATAQPNTSEPAVAHTVPAKISSRDIIQWYMEQNQLGLSDDGLEATEMVSTYATANNLSLNGQESQVAGKVRVQLSRMRAEQGIRINSN